MNFADQGILRGNEQVDEKEYLTDAFGREAVAFIEKHKAEPFFLYLAFNAVHTPMQADDPRLMKFAHISDKQRRTYAAIYKLKLGIIAGCLLLVALPAIWETVDRNLTGVPESAMKLGLEALAALIVLGFVVRYLRSKETRL